MKTYRLLNYFFCLLFLGQLMSCKKSDDLLANYFNETEIKTIEKIIQYFDDYVISQTSNQLPIDKAYIAYFEKMQDSIEQADDFNMFLPSIDERILFYKTLDRKILSEIYKINDSLTIRFRREDAPRKIYRPYSFDLNYQGRYMAFLKELSLRNDFYKKYYESIESAGDISPANYAMIFHDFNKIDFSKKEERLVAIINLLRTGETVRDEK